MDRSFTFPLLSRRRIAKTGFESSLPDEKKRNFNLLGNRLVVLGFGKAVCEFDECVTVGRSVESSDWKELYLTWPSWKRDKGPTLLCRHPSTKTRSSALTLDTQSTLERFRDAALSQA